MEIDEAIKGAREAAKSLYEKSNGMRFLFEFRLGDLYLWRASAIETVCDKLEALLAEREEIEAVCNKLEAVLAELEENADGD